MGAILENRALDRRFSSEREIRENFEKVLAPASVPHFGRPCRGLRTLTGLRPQRQGGEPEIERPYNF